MANDTVRSQFGEFMEIETSKLRFDPENPRFVEADPDLGSDEERIIKFLIDHVDLNELIQSIAEVGFIDLEPMLVMKKDDEFVVLEGNRRLAAIRILQDTDLQDKLRVSVPKLDAQKRASLKSVRAFVMRSRDASRAFIGFKHINGPHKWNSISKAKYAAQWFREGGDLNEIARTWGDSHNTVRRLVNGWFVLEQAKDAGFETEDRTSRRFSFSHLYIAITRPGYREWLGLPPDDPTESPSVTPVKKDRIGNLLVLMSWLYGRKSEDEPAVIRSQNPDLGQLSEILLNSSARALFLEKRDLDVAYQEVVPPERRFESALVQSAKYAGDALALSDGYRGDLALLDTGKRLAQQSRNLVLVMEKYVEEADS